MKYIFTGDMQGRALDIMVDAELYDSTDAKINEAIGNHMPGTIIYTAGFARIKQKDFDGSWVEVVT